MASSSFTIKVDGEILRKYGGNRSSVRKMYDRYSNMSKESLMKRHYYINDENIDTVEFITSYNKK